MEEIIIKKIGIIRTPYLEPRNIPIQGCFNDTVEGICILKNEFKEGLESLDGFSHAILIYHFHKAGQVTNKGKPFLEDTEHGIFSIRSPYRPNKIGFSIVKIIKIEENMLHFTEVDMLNDTPLIDIKPYVKYFDSRQDVSSGWIDKHFKDNKIPSRVVLK